MFGQVAGWVVLLAIGCNVITGVGDLKVSAVCSPDAGQACDPGTGVTTDPMPLEPPPTSGTGGAGFRADDAGPGGSDDCATNRDLPFVSTPSNVFGADPGSGCGAGGSLAIGSGNTADGGTGGAETGGGETGGQNQAGTGGAGTGPPVSTLCAAGALQACTGAGNCAGSQSCLADGSGYSSCQCVPMPVAVSGSIAAACATDADCAAGLTCTTSADVAGAFSNGTEPGGPQNGYCSRACNTDAECQAADPGAICLGPGNGLNHCFASCNVQLPSFPMQCNARDDLTCVGVATDPPRAYCAPACHDDAGCAPRFCNLATGLCQDQPRTGKPIGASCTKDECAGGCIALRGQPGVCTGICTFGSSAGCGFAANAPQRDAACIDTTLGNGVGPGLCKELCDVDSDCEQQAAGWVCTPWSIDVILDYALAYDRIGFCQLEPLGSGDGAGTGNTTGICTEDCPFARDGGCDDGGPGAATDICLFGTDCTDCGAR